MNADRFFATVSTIANYSCKLIQAITYCFHEVGHIYTGMVATYLTRLYNIDVKELFHPDREKTPVLSTICRSPQQQQG